MYNHSNNNKTILVGSLIGNIMEFYDFALYGYLIVYLKSNFFPEGNQYTQSLLFWGSFLSGYLSRPIGAVFFGRVADKFGRKTALLWSVSLMTVATFLMGILPSYGSIGILSTVTIFLLRITQGFAVSGEEGTVAVYLSEVFNKKIDDGKVSAGILISILFGVLLGSSTCFLVQFFCTEEGMNEFGWRIPYLLSVVLGVTAIYYRVRSEETLNVIKKSEGNSESFLQFFKKNIKYLMALFFIPIVFAVPISISLVVIPSLLSGIEFSPINPLVLCSMGIFCTCVFSYFVGSVSNQIGHKRTMYIGCIVLLMLGYPIAIMIQLDNVVFLLIGQLFLSAAISMTSAPLFVMMISEFPVKYRCVGFSLILNTGMAVFAGTTPWIVEFVTARLNEKSFFGFYLMFAGLVGVFALISLKSKSLILRGASYESI
jgi:MHS family proline/betaine transporter-like MFS transporter